MKPLRLGATTLLMGATFAAFIQCSGSTADAVDVSCGALGACCVNGSLAPAEQQDCTVIATAGAEESCAAVIPVYCGELPAPGLDAGSSTGPRIGTGTGTGTTPVVDATVPNAACIALTACCAGSGLSTDEMAECYADANTGVATTCMTALSGYQAAGICSAAGSGTGSGTGTGAGTGTGTGTGTGGMCASFCTVDIDCASTCPAQIDVTYCCDSVASVCYETTNFTCPAASADAGIDSSMY
jgi:hypothetical protein